MAIESMGIPLPGETMLVAAAILGDNLGYLIGREGGYRLLRRYGRYIRIEDRHIKLGQYLFMKHGGKVVFFGRFIAALRALAAFLAGVNRMRWPRFLFFNALGGITWATLYGLGGYYLGDNIHRLTGTIGIVVIVLAVCLILWFLFFLHRNEQRLEAEAEQALPGPLDEYEPTRSRDKHHV